MAIVLKYGSPGPILAAGYAAGAGHQMHEQQGDALKVWQQNQQQQFQAGQSWLDRLQQQNLQQGYFANQAQQASLARISQGAQAGLQRQFQAGQAEAGRQFQAGQTQTVLAARAGESALERQQREQLAQDAQLHADLRSGDMVLPPAVREKINKLDSGISELTGLAPAGKDQFMAEYTKRRRELMSMAIPRSTQTDAERLAEARKTLPEEHQGLPLVIDDNNKLSVLPGWKPDTSGAEAQKQRDTQITKYHDSNMKMVDENGKPKYSSPDESMTAAIDQYNTVQNRLRGAGPTPTPEPTPSAAYSQSQGIAQQAMAAGATAWSTNTNQPGNIRMTMPSGVASVPQAAPQVAGPAAPAAPAEAATDFDRQWANLKPGESLRGPDGKLYTKRNK